MRARACVCLRAREGRCVRACACVHACAMCARTCACACKCACECACACACASASCLHLAGSPSAISAWQRVHTAMEAGVSAYACGWVSVVAYVCVCTCLRKCVLACVHALINKKTAITKHSVAPTISKQHTAACIYCNWTWVRCLHEKKGVIKGWQKEHASAHVWQI